LWGRQKISIFDYIFMENLDWQLDHSAAKRNLVNLKQ